MRKEKITTGEYYHIYNRGINKQTIFHDRADYVRFLFLILHFQSPKRFINIGRIIFHFLKNGFFKIDPENLREVITYRSAELILFCIMANHFHIVAKQLNDKGVAEYMHRVLGGYSKYYNKKYGTSGHLFQDNYKAVLIKNNTQLLYVGAYIHRNSRTLPGWNQKEHLYEWSSYQDYIGPNRFGNLLSQSIILDQFESKKHYYDFLQSSTAKER